MTNQIDLSQLSDEELLELQTNVRGYIHNKRIPEPDFYLNNSIQIESTSYVNPNTLVPTLEFKISVNKEDIEHYRVLWENYYKKEQQFFRYHHSLPPDKQTTLDIKHAIGSKLIEYLDGVFPTVHYG
jgi:hypothetical protein